MVDLVHMSTEVSIGFTNYLGFKSRIGTIFYPPNNLNVLLGDLNFDQIINVVDIISIVNIITLSLDYNYLADLNDDGIINVIDIIAVVNMIIN